MIKSKISNNSFVSEILASSQREHHHDVTIVCSNGAVKSNSFLLASMFPILRGILDTPVQLGDAAVIFLPDLDKIDLETFFDGLLSPALELKVCRDMAVLLMPVGAIIDSDLDIGLPDHVKDQEYLNTIKDRLPSLLDEVRPDAVLYDAGVYPRIDDDLGKLESDIKAEIELESPEPDALDRGRIEFFVDCSANATHSFEGRGGEDLASDRDTNMDIEPDIKAEIPDPFPCEHCGQLCESKQDLSVHIRSRHQLKDGICDICGKEFKKAKSLENHINSVHSTQKCEICGKSFKPPAFRYHRKICQPSYSCKDCDYKTSIKQEYDKHRRNHNVKVKKSFKCVLCTYSSGRITDLKRHMRQKHTEKLKCDSDGCDKEFAHEESLERHKEIHSPKLACHLCDKKFVRQSYLDQHILKYHCRNTIETSSGFMLLHRTEKVIRKKNCFYCPKCDYKSNVKGNLKQHIHRMHNKPRNVVTEKDKHCKRCNFTFTKYTSLKRHQLHCRVDTSKGTELQDYVELMRLRNFNFSDISAINRFNRRRFGRKAALPNLSRTLRKAVEEMKEFFTVETLTFQRNKKTEKTDKKKGNL